MLKMLIVVCLLMSASLAQAQDDPTQWCQINPTECVDPWQNMDPMVTTPEPGTWVLMGTGVAGLVAWRIRARKGK
jgi:hypothetical protein